MLTILDIPSHPPAFYWSDVLPKDVDLSEVKLRRANEQFLGSHKQAMFGTYRDKHYGKLPANLKEISQLMIRVAKPRIKRQRWTTAFVAEFGPGDYVKKHRDPMSNVNYTLIGVFGDFEGAVTNIYTGNQIMQVALKPGYLLALPCTINGQQGPYHSVSNVQTGVRKTLILNEVK